MTTESAEGQPPFFWLFDDAASDGPTRKEIETRWQNFNERHQEERDTAAELPVPRAGGTSSKGISGNQDQLRDFPSACPPTSPTRWHVRLGGHCLDRTRSATWEITNGTCVVRIRALIAEDLIYLRTEFQEQWHKITWRVNGFDSGATWFLISSGTQKTDSHSREIIQKMTIKIQPNRVGRRSDTKLMGSIPLLPGLSLAVGIIGPRATYDDRVKFLENMSNHAVQCQTTGRTCGAPTALSHNLAAGLSDVVQHGCYSTLRRRGTATPNTGTTLAVLNNGFTRIFPG
ncbi:hypothetical protein BKA93DRAFT_750616 [Sparassis latifolia]